MELSEIKRAILRRRELLRAEGVSHLSLFGSRTDGTARHDSDLDILIETDPDVRFSILNLVGVEQMIGEATGIKANAFMKRSLDRRFREEVSGKSVPVF
jgi:predicted nucleotidyltransferase